MGIGTEDEANEPRERVGQVVMVVPADGQVNEAHTIGRKDGQEPAGHGPGVSVRHPRFQNHDDGDDAITECGHPIVPIGSVPLDVPLPLAPPL